MDLLGRMRTFTRVVESGSLSAAAREQQQGVAAVSKQLAALEAHLDTRLISRSTHALHLTEAGTAYYQRCLEVLAAVDEAEATVGRARATPMGTVRVSCTVAFGSMRLMPHLPAFLADYPDLRLDLLMQDARVDLIREGVDVAVRFGVLDDADLMAKRIGRDARVIVASRDYLDRRGRPAAVDELSGHDAVLLNPTRRDTRWTLIGDDGPQEVEVAGRVQVDSAIGLRAAVIAGLGCGMAPRWLFAPEIAAGTVEVLLPDAPPSAIELHALYPRSRYPSARTRVFLDFLKAMYAHPDAHAARLTQASR